MKHETSRNNSANCDFYSGGESQKQDENSTFDDCFCRGDDRNCVYFGTLLGHRGNPAPIVKRKKHVSDMLFSFQYFVIKIQFGEMAVPALKNPA